MTRAGDDAERSDEVGARPLAAARLGVPPPSCGGERRNVIDEQRALVAQACRVAAARGLVDGILGHLSLRVDDERLLLRCRSDTDSGVA
ncbi:MAG: class II aldolase/adducin family protein, partial [Mycobacterium sp.]